jgi:hypothetical protein
MFVYSASGDSGAMSPRPPPASPTTRPRASTSTKWVPSFPRSCASYCRSRPALPTSCPDL